jgi:formate hydrogenlyase subunit 3/multisubunit Na+/H+ antiporter MnhD subunit
VLRELGVIVLVLLALGFFAASIYVLDYSSSKPLWERIVYCALSVLLIIAAACMVFMAVMLASYTMLEKLESGERGL